MHLTTRSHNLKYVLNSSIKLGDSPPSILFSSVQFSSVAQSCPTLHNPILLVSCLIADKWKMHNFGNGLKISRNLLSLESIPKPYPKVKTDRQPKNELENRCIPFKA